MPLRRLKATAYRVTAWRYRRGLALRWTDEEKRSICLQTNAPTRPRGYKISKLDHLLPWRWNG